MIAIFKVRQIKLTHLKNIIASLKIELLAINRHLRLKRTLYLFSIQAHILRVYRRTIWQLLLQRHFLEEVTVTQLQTDSEEDLLKKLLLD